MYPFSKEKTAKYAANYHRIVQLRRSVLGETSFSIGILSFHHFSGAINGAVNGDPNFLKCTRDLFYTAVPNSQLSKPLFGRLGTYPRMLRCDGGVVLAGRSRCMMARCMSPVLV